MLGAALLKQCWDPRDRFFYTGDPDLQTPLFTSVINLNTLRLSDIIERYDALLNIGLLIIATVLGMSLLWYNDPVWGGWSSYSTAFLWGLGLHQVGGAGFEGVPAITKKLKE